MYSQNAEEKYIRNYFGEFKGTFISIGENDGITLSNVRALMELGWNGICVEPSPRAFEALKKNVEQFPQIYAYPFALGETNGKVKMWDSGEHLGKGDSGLLSTMSEEDHNKWKASTKFEQIEVQCFRWKTFLNRIKYKKFDLISIDVEGKDLEVLRQIDLGDTHLLCIEWNSVEERRKEILDYTSRFAMKSVIYTSTENLIISK